jgi:tetratricopeptide (TPR) repeat protein
LRYVVSLNHSRLQSNVMAYNPNGAEDYDRVISTLNPDDSGPKLPDPGRLAAQLRGETVQEHVTDWPYLEKSGPEMAEPRPPISAAAEAARAQEQRASALKIDALKLAGNTALQQGDHKDAIQQYTQGLGLVDKLGEEARNEARMALHNNRSMAFLQAGQAAAAVADASVVLQVRRCNLSARRVAYACPLLYSLTLCCGLHCQHLESGNPKALFRRGLAYKKMGNFKLAIHDLEKLCNAQPANAAARQELASAYELGDRSIGLDEMAGGSSGESIAEIVRERIAVDEASASSTSTVKIAVVEDSDDESSSEDEDELD